MIYQNWAIAPFTKGTFVGVVCTFLGRKHIVVADCWNRGDQPGNRSNLINRGKSIVDWETTHRRKETK